MSLLMILPMLGGDKKDGELPDGDSQTVGSRIIASGDGNSKQPYLPGASGWGRHPPLAQAGCSTQRRASRERPHPRTPLTRRAYARVGRHPPLAQAGCSTHHRASRERPHPRTPLTRRACARVERFFGHQPSQGSVDIAAPTSGEGSTSSSETSDATDRVVLREALAVRQ